MERMPNPVKMKNVADKPIAFNKTGNNRPTRKFVINRQKIEIPIASPLKWIG